MVVIRQKQSSSDDESGFALLLTVFILALITLLVMGFSEETSAFQRSSRSFSEQVQAGYVLKSGVNLARLLLEAPRPEGSKDQDSLNDAWNNIGAAPSVPIEGFVGEMRLMITDEDGKIDVNSVYQSTFVGVGAGTNPFGQQPGLPGTSSTGTDGGGATDGAVYWKNAMAELFRLSGFKREQFSDNEFHTFGGKSFEPEDQVAVISDWIDRDEQAYRNSAFKGEGIESGENKSWFYNRPFRSIAELAAVPGITLEHLRRIAPFVKVSSGFSGVSSTVNINTAPVEVLMALGFPQADALEVAEKRRIAPLTQEIIPTLTAGSPQLQGRLKVNSNEFAAYGRVVMPTRTFWVRALISTQGQPPQRKTVVRYSEFY